MSTRPIDWEKIQSDNDSYDKYSDIHTCCAGGISNYCPSGTGKIGDVETNTANCSEFYQMLCTEGKDDDGEPMIHDKMCSGWCAQNQTMCRPLLERTCLPEINWAKGGTVTLSAQRACHCYHPQFVFDEQARVIAATFGLPEESSLISSIPECISKACTLSTYRNTAVSCPSNNFATCIQDSSLSVGGMLDTNSLSIDQSCEINIGGSGGEDTVGGSGGSGGGDATSTDPCTSNNDCMNGQACSDGKCVDKQDPTLTYILIGAGVLVLVGIIVLSSGKR